MTGRLSPSEEQLALLLLEEALAADGPDPASFIAAQKGYDRSVRERATRLLASADVSVSNLRTGGAAEALGQEEADAPLPASVGDFQIIELLGRGGMGAVYRAQRASADFDHQVAIKVIKPGLVTPGLLERFRRERQILAQLRHPHIAQLFDGGETADGAPYIVMELIDGMSLSRFLRREQPDLETRLSLMAQICDAVEFAHQNLIVHRDLTPGNVLVDARGDAKLIDFGIARPHGPAGEPQVQSALSGLTLTPGYAAPERKAGAPVTTLSDVYSLGQILGLLTEDFDEPELEAIARKAANENPDQRYDGAGALGRDIARFGAGHAVAAYSGARFYRIGKYVRRNRLPVALAAVLVMLMVGGTALLTDAYRDAARERDNAEQRFDEVRSLANFLLFDLYDELEDVPGTTKALNDIADHAKEYLGILSASDTTNVEVRLDAALAYKRLSDVLGTPIAANLGRREEAGETLDQAILELRALHAAYPEDEAITKGLAEALYSQAVFAFISLDDNLLAHESAAQSARLYWQLAKAGDAETYAAQALDAEVEAATPLAWVDRGGEAVDLFRRTLVKLERHLAEYGRSASNVGLLARTQSAMSETMGRLADAEGGDYEEALSTADQAIASYREYVRKSERPDGARRSMAVALYKRSLLLYSMDRLDRALADLEEAEEIVAAQAEIDPEDAGLKRSLAVFREQKAMTLAHSGKAAEALELVLRSMQIKRAASEQEPDNPGLLRDYAANLLLVAEVAEVGGRKQAACSYNRLAKQTYARFARRNELSDYDREVVTADLPEAIERLC